MSERPFRQICSLWIHDEAFSTDDVLVSKSQIADGTKEGEVMQIAPLRKPAKHASNPNESQKQFGDPATKSGSSNDRASAFSSSTAIFGDHTVDFARRHIFTLKEINPSQDAKQPGLQVSVLSEIASKFDLKNGDQVLLSAVDEPVKHASHVEITFRDEYLTRADMWRLAVTTLANKTIYTGQRIVFMSTIKALVKSIFFRGTKVESAYFGAGTKPIFRSESARYVLFIQMSKEMWNFDADGSGEIMFSKVINGFLPDLFKRWQKIGVKHLISIVLFTRLEYERNPLSNLSQAKSGDWSTEPLMNENHYQDFYRVVISDMASAQWMGILSQLKTEFKTFLRDVSIRQPHCNHHMSSETGPTVPAASNGHQIISGLPSTAIQGNILEAINLASSQFSYDHIDRDLVRTGVSITVISPGTGLFEVDHQLLVKTTENLIENGISIDLVCLSRMPLHSVPLFKYRNCPSPISESLAQNEKSEHHKASLHGLVVSPDQDEVSGQSSPNSVHLSQRNDSRHLTAGRWSYGIPHWIDVSFWTSSSIEDRTQAAILGESSRKVRSRQKDRKTFIPRVRMYEIQMMGVTENAMCNISLPYLSQLTTSQGHQSSIRSISPPLKAKSPANRNNAKDSLDTSKIPKNATTKTLATSSRFRLSKDVLLPYHWMDEYDNIVFRSPEQQGAVERKARKTRQLQQTQGNHLHRVVDHSTHDFQLEQFGSSSKIRTSPDDQNLTDQVLEGRTLMHTNAQKKGSIATSISSSNVSLMKPTNSSRRISFGPRGFSSGTLKAMASTEVSAEHAKSGASLGRGHRVRSAAGAKNEKTLSPNANGHNRRSSDTKSVDRNSDLQDMITTFDGSQKSSRPIPIRNITVLRVNGEQIDESHTPEEKAVSDTITNPRNLDSGNQYEISSRPPALMDSHEVLTAVSPSSSTAPWLTILNPSNPHEANFTMANRLGRWQHVYPRRLSASKIKWKSLCSPAAIPLTTEDFPSPNQLAREYQERQYRVAPLMEKDTLEQPRSHDWLLREMMAFRFSHGFQVVVGLKVIRSMDLSNHQLLEVFQNAYSSSNGSTVVMSKGSIIHRLSYSDAGCVHVKCFTRHALRSSSKVSENLIYRPAIRTMHANEYNLQEINLTVKRTETDWESIDNFISGNEKPQQEPFAENLRSWRARFVLIPVDSPSSGRRPLHPINEDDEEEVRLEGIRKLTQVWQRFRYIPVNQRRFQAPTRRRKDTNPLDIMYQTRDPSAIIAAELDSIGEYESTGRPVQLLPETDLYQRSKLNLASIAQVIQSEKGVRMQDRRWHLRLHYNCFIGFELTTWILQNFRDVETRDEAVDLGNELMKSGLFQHVEQRHNFRDGNYFYQISSEYRIPRPDSSRSWFGSRRIDRSVPSTPLSDDNGEGSPRLPRSRANSTGENQSETEPSTPVGKKQRLEVALSKSLLYDVDHRRRSHRPEVITLHYDRLHNPDNCYHIRIDWMSVTAKLIEDVIVSWATAVDRFGLRLVEVPLGEAAAITGMHPFRAPYLVQLVQSPPEKQPRSYIDVSSFTTQDRTEKHFYQKAILKKFQFVLDFEAASDFPSDVEVTYSWGRPNYRYPQFIHRSGVLIAQITEKGDFLLLANRLYNNRSARNEDVEGTDAGDVPGGTGKFSPVRSGDRCSPRSSLYSSPSIRAVQDVQGSKSGLTRSGQSAAFVSPEQIKAEFESFCVDRVALDQFYNQILTRAPSSGPNTPFMEGGIPALGLPPSIALPEGLSSLDSKNHGSSAS